MYRFGKILFTALLVFSIGCGKSSQKKAQVTEQQTQPGTVQMAPHGASGQYSSIDMAIRWTSQLGQFVTFEEGQEVKIQDVYKKFADKMKEINLSGPGIVMSDAEWQAMRDKMATIYAERDQEIRAILSERQLPKYEEFLIYVKDKK